MEIPSRNEAGRIRSDQMVSVIFPFLFVNLTSFYVHSFDSIQDGSVAICTPHTGFKDPATAEGTPARQSIELRALVFYD